MTGVGGVDLRPPGQRKDPGTFRTKVLCCSVDPRLCCYYKFSRLKQYFKEHRPNSDLIRNFVSAKLH
jgi:hypothetical protein